MKKLFTLILALSCFTIFAQNNPGLKITFNGKNIANISASFGGVMDADTPLCAEVVHVKGTGTSTQVPPFPSEEGCNSLTNAAELKGKIALIRRGTCEFGDKCLRAEEAGAIAVIIYNRVDPDNANEPINMGVGAVGGSVTIPCAMISLDDGLLIYDAIKKGTKPTVCFSVPSKQINEVYANPWGSMYPQNQLDTIYPTISFTNTSDSVSAVVSKVDIVSPSGVKTTLSRTHDLGTTETGFVNIIPIAGLYPSEKGVYKASFYTTFLTDTVTSQFIVSDYTFGNDLNQALPKGVTRDKATFVATDLKVSNILNFYVTGEADSKATFATFGLRNASQLKNRDISITLLETDVDRIDAISATTLSPGDIGDIVGDIVTYTIKGTESADQLITIPLKDGTKKGIDMNKNSAYALVLEYDGTSIKNDSIAPEWTLGKTVPSRWPGINMFGSALMTGARYYTGGWGEIEDPIGRLHIDGFTIGTKNLATLEASEVSFFPNPTSDMVNVKIDLKENAKTVQLGIMDFTGRIINTYDLDVQNGIVPVNISNYPAGTYFFTVKTDKAFTTEKIIKR